MPSVAVLHHLAERSCGHAAAALRAGGVDLDERDLRAGDPLPRLDEVDGLLSLGGEQSVLGGALSDEAELLREAVARECRCSASASARSCWPMPSAERGRRERRLVAWPVIEALPAAADDPLLGTLPTGAVGLHWNEDGFEPPPGAVELLRRPARAREGVPLRACAWGVQFHPEVDEAILDGWYRDWPDACAQAGVRVSDARAADADTWAVRPRSRRRSSAASPRWSPPASQRDPRAGARARRRRRPAGRPVRASRRRDRGPRRARARRRGRRCPASAEEVAAVVAWCYEHDVPIVPRGGGTGLAGGAVPRTAASWSRSSACARCARSTRSCGGCSVEAGVRTRDGPAPRARERAAASRPTRAPPSSRRSAATSRPTPAGRTRSSTA